MRTTALVAAAVALSLALAGCSGIVPSPVGTETTASADAAPDDATATETSSPSQSATPTLTPEPTATATPEYEEPQPPNTPMEGKHREDGMERIRSVEFVNAERTDGGAYSNFDLRVGADTRMSNVDPADHGDVEGEPYFLVYVEGELVERSEIVAHRNGTFEVRVHPGALRQFDDGSLELRLLLMDRDSQYDDVYGVWETSFEYEREET